MNTKLLSLLAAGVLVGTVAAYAVPAKPGLRTITQPDGSTVVAELRGDEYFSFYVTTDGTPMQLAADGYLRYVTTTPDGAIELVADKPAADNDAVFRAFTTIAAERRAQAASIADAIPVAMAAEGSNPRDEMPWTGLGLMNRQNFPRTGNIKSVVILVEYTDVSFTTENANDFFTRMINGEEFSDYGAVGSARKYFIDNSMGQFVPDFDVYGPVKVSRERAYYGAQSGSSHDIRPGAMVTEAVNLVNQQYPDADFSQYDLDNDGFIDNVYIIYAGQGQATYGGPDTIWPHSSTITNGILVDGVRLGRYACSNEWEYDRPDGIGTFIHEFSHVMGLPDLYATQYTGAITPGTWSVMDQGPYNGQGMCPPFYTAYERNALGWIDLDIIDGPLNGKLYPIQDNRAYIIPSVLTNEFFLLEYRNRTDWDAGTPGNGGMLVWHINYDPTVFNYNRVNNDPDKQYVDIVKAGASESKYPFPNGIKRRIAPTTNPNLTPWVGPVIQFDISNIRVNSEGYVTFIVDGGASSLDVPVATEASAAGSNGFTANWQPVADAVSYAVTVAHEIAATATAQSLPFGSASDTQVVLPDGWSFSGAANDIYTAGTTFYGPSGKPSLKFGSNDISLTSPVFEGVASNVEFFIRSVTPPANSSFVVFGRSTAAESWRVVKTIDNLSDYSTRGQTLTIDLTGRNVSQIKFSYYGESGRIALDDVKVDFAPTYPTPLEGFVRLDAGTATSLPINLVPDGTGKYSYYVEALDADGSYTRHSNTVTVDLSAFLSGVENITIDDANAPVEYFNLQGVRVENPANGIYIRRQGNSVTKIVVE